MESTDDDVKATTDKEVKSSDDTMNQKEEGYANEPEEKTKGYNPNDFANIINKVKTADLEPTPYGSASNPMPEAEEDDEEKMAESLEEKLMNEYRKFMAESKKAKPDFLDMDKDGNKKEPMKKALKDKEVDESMDDEEVEESTGDYSAKKARAGKDIGKPGKNFEKIAKKAGAKYGSKEKGEKVAGAVLAKLRK